MLKQGVFCIIFAHHKIISFAVLFLFREIFIEESNVQRIDLPVTVSGLNCPCTLWCNITGQLMTTLLNCFQIATC